MLRSSSVIVPMRRGYGLTGGVFAESFGSCASPDFYAAGEQAALDLDAAIAYARKLPWVDGQRIVLVGQSAGGFASIAAASRNIPGVAAAVNMSGGRGGNPRTRPGEPCASAQMAEAISRFARALGAARSGRLDAVTPELTRLDELHRKTLELKDTYWAGIIDIQRRGATAWYLFAQGKKNEGIEMMRMAADAEDATEKSVVTPAPLAPAREMLGFMLLEAGRADDALVAFDAAIAKEPNRFLALYGAGRAAEKSNQPQRAKGYYGQIVAICKDAPAGRPELLHARERG